MTCLRQGQIAEPSPISFSVYEHMSSLKWFCNYANENPTYACLSLLADFKLCSENVKKSLLASNIVFVFHIK